MKKLAMVFALILPLGAAQAQEVDCDNAMTQSDMNYCSAMDYQAADDDLNQTYQELMAVLDQPDRTLLKAAQRAWVSYRDAQCTFDTAGTATGSIHPMLLASCMASLTEQQTAQLKLSLNCEEGDLSCAGH